MESKRNKQEVNELARDIYSMFRSDSMSRALASVLHSEGYRKANKVAEEILAALKQAGIDELRYPVVAELRQKYIGETE